MVLGDMRRAFCACLLTDYKQPLYWIDTVNLNFILNEDVTHVHSTLSLRPNTAHDVAGKPLVLNGRKDVKLVSLKVGRETDSCQLGIPVLLKASHQNSFVYPK